MKEECEIFQDTIEELALVDVITGKGWFTWNNKWSGERHISSHLDLFLVSESIIHLGSEMHSSTLPGVGFDNWPIELMWSRLVSQFKNPSHSNSSR